MLAIITAMQKEADVLLDLSSIQKSYILYGKKIYEGVYQNHRFTLCVCGVGKVNAAIGATLMIAQGAKTLLNLGVAGGLTPKAKIGTVLHIDKAVEFDFDLSAINHTPIGTLDEYRSPYLPLCGNSVFPHATLATADHFGCGGTDDSVIRAIQADVRDMEGAAVAHAAFAANVRCFSYKSISDNAGENSPAEYCENLKTALNSLQKLLPQIFTEVLNG